jgi:hypothetical protein
MGRMKDVIELLEKTVLGLEDSLDGLVNLEKIPAHYIEIEYIEDAITSINEAISELKTPRWYTPEQYKEKTGEPWLGSGAVYVRRVYNTNADGTPSYGSWNVVTYEKALEPSIDKQIACAYRVPGPPPDDWEPEEEE